MGGAVGQWVATQAPGRVTALVLANSSPRLDPAIMETRRETVLKSGMSAVAESTMLRFFSPETLAHNPYARSIRSVFLGTDPAGYAGCCAALRDADSNQALPRIHAPTLLIVGDQDVSTPWAGHVEILAREIAGAQTVHLSTTHLSNIERPRAFTTTVLEFLERATNSINTATDPLQAGSRVRRAVLGDEHVNHAEATTNDFNADFQNLITRFAWGTIWTRPGLDHRTRRLLVLAITAALGRWEEFRLHLRAALSHGLEPCDVKEVLLQVAVYAGVPGANTAFPIAQKEIEKHKTGTIHDHGEKTS
jgi:3-oxoadipate enol-lactonase/4-carboxymuconolactone decarboxylase